MYILGQGWRITIAIPWRVEHFLNAMCRVQNYWWSGSMTIHISMPEEASLRWWIESVSNCGKVRTTPGLCSVIPASISRWSQSYCILLLFVISCNLNPPKLLIFLCDTLFTHSPCYCCSWCIYSQFHQLKLPRCHFNQIHLYENNMRERQTSPTKLIDLRPYFYPQLTHKGYLLYLRLVLPKHRTYNDLSRP